MRKQLLAVLFALFAVPVWAQPPVIIQPAPYVSGAGIAAGSITFPTGTGLKTGTTAGNTLLLQAYDTDTGPAYTTLATLTAGTTPTIAIPALTGSMTLAGTALAGSAATSTLAITQTWNTTGAPTAFKLTITDTASDAASLAMQILGGAAGTTNLMKVTKSGAATFGSSVTSTAGFSTDAVSGLYLSPYAFMRAGASGVVNIYNENANGFTRLNLGLNTSLFPALSVTSAATPTLTVIAGDGSGASNLSVTGTLTVSGAVALPYIAKTADYTATTANYVIDCTANSFIVTLPTAAGIAGRLYVIKNSGAGVITLDGNAAETIDGSATWPILAGAALTVQSNGTNWIVL